MTNKLQSSASFTTEKASQYLQTMCKHFGHKLTCEFTPLQGRIEFPFGLCELSANSPTLDLAVGAATQEDLERLQGVIGSHLARFAFREEPTLAWS